MVMEARGQAKVGVGVEVLWRALSKDLRFVLPKVAPNLVRDVELLEGDGGLGTIMRFHFGPDVSHMTQQKERIVELDESQLRIGLQVIEGGHLNLGFTSYGTFFKLTGTGDIETLVDFKVRFDAVTEDESLPAKTASSTLAFIKHLEDYLLKTSA
ncbi:hypothetical protein AAC387_Pa04g1751 [Persea americana]